MWQSIAIQAFLFSEYTRTRSEDVTSRPFFTLLLYAPVPGYCLATPPVVAGVEAPRRQLLHREVPVSLELVPAVLPEG